MSKENNIYCTKVGIWRRMQIFYQQRIENIDVPPSALPLFGCTDTYGNLKSIIYLGTQLFAFFWRVRI